MFQCVEHQIERLDRLLSLGCVHPFEKAVDDGVVLEGGIPRAACPSDEDSTAGHRCREAHDRVIVDHKGFNVVTAIAG